MGRIRQIITAEGEDWPETIVPILPQEVDNTHTCEDSVNLLEFEKLTTTYFEPPRRERFEGFEMQKIKYLLDNIKDAVYDHDREICYAKELFHSRNEISVDEPLRAWDRIDPGQHLVAGKDRFEVNGKSNNLSESHAPNDWNRRG